MATDVRFDFVDGKPRFRRDNPNDRQILNLAPLVAALSGLPQPRRDDRRGNVEYPLDSKAFVIDTIDCNIVRQTATEITIEPVSAHILHGSSFNVQHRIEALLDEAASDPVVENWLRKVRAAENDADLATLAKNVNALFPLRSGNDDDTGGEDDDEKDGDGAGDEGAGEGGADGEDDEFVTAFKGKEGKAKIRLHRVRERNRTITRNAKKYFRQKYGTLFCEACGLDPEAMLGKYGESVIEAHHKKPLGELDDETETAVTDFEMYCRNCHRMIHNTTDLSGTRIRDVLKSKGLIVDQSKLDLLAY